MRVARFCGRCRRQLTSNTCDQCNIYYGPQNTHPVLGLGCLTLVFIQCAGGAIYGLMRWMRGETIDERMMEAYKWAGAIGAVLAILIPLIVRKMWISRRQ